MLTEDESYVQNFWKPKVGHRILFNGPVTIRSIDKKYPEQVAVRETDEILFLQDHSWKPSREDLLQILTDLGCVVSKDIIRAGKRSWKDMPAGIEGFAGLIREVRLILHTESGRDPLETYFEGSAA